MRYFFVGGIFQQNIHASASFRLYKNLYSSYFYGKVIYMNGFCTIYSHKNISTTLLANIQFFRNGKKPNIINSEEERK